MRLCIIYENIGLNLSIVRYDPESFDVDYDPNIVADQADNIAMKSNIRVGRDKELLYVALVDGNTVGAVWSSLSKDHDTSEYEDVYVFDFDVVVDPAFRSHSPEYRIGIKLIEAALQEYNHLKSEHKVYIRVWVVNPKLVKFLERQYNFEIESQHRDGSAHMVYHG